MNASDGAAVSISAAGAEWRRSGIIQVRRDLRLFMGGNMKRLFSFTLLFLLFLTSASYSESFNGRVIMVKDGANIFVKSGENTYPVKLYGIECPEPGQDYGEQSRQFAEDLLNGKDVWVDVIRMDHRKRHVSKVVVDGRDASVEIAGAGLAWYDSRAYSAPTVAGAQVEAQAKKAGIWSQPNPLSPWDYRYRKSGINPVMSKEIGNIPAGSFNEGLVTASWPSSRAQYLCTGSWRYYYRPGNRSSPGRVSPPSSSGGPFTNNIINRNPFTNNIINNRSF